MKLMSIAIVVLLAILASTAGTFPGSKEKTSSDSKTANLALASVDAEESSSSAEAEEANQCGVTESEIISYLQNCSHHHTVYWLQDIPGTCHTRAGIEGGKIATVYVNEGIIIGHQDNQADGGGSNSSTYEGGGSSFNKGN